MVGQLLSRLGLATRPSYGSPEWLTRPASDGGHGSLAPLSTLDSSSYLRAPKRRWAGDAGPVHQRPLPPLYMHELPSHSARATDESPPLSGASATAQNRSRRKS